MVSKKENVTTPATLVVLVGLRTNTILATIIMGGQKAPFSVATTLRCWERRYSFHWIAPLYLSYIPYIAEF